MITKQQHDNFMIADPDDVPVRLPQNPATPKWNPLSQYRDNLQPNAWTSDRIKIAEKSLVGALSINGLIPPDEAELQNRLNTWWTTEGQNLPRFVLDQIGIVGGEKVPTITEMDKLDRKRQVDVVKDYLGVKPDPKGGDPLAPIVVADPKDVSLEEIPPKASDIIKSADIEDLKKIHDIMLGNEFEFDEKVVNAISDEIKIREAIDNVIIPEMQERPLTTLIGTEFFNKLYKRLPEYTSRKGFNPYEMLAGKDGDISIIMRAAGRVRSQLAQQDPRLLTRIGLEAGDIGATLIHFALLPDIGKARVFAKLPKAVKAAIGVGTKAGLIELLQAPREGETVPERLGSVAIATGSGAVVGGIFSLALSGLSAVGKPIVQKIESVKAEMIRNALIKRSPKLEPYLKTIGDEQVNNLRNAINDSIKVQTGEMTQAAWDQTHRPFVTAMAKDAVDFMRNITPQRGIVPTGFRAGMAEIEGAGEAAKKALPKIGEAAKGGVSKIVAVTKKTMPVEPVKPKKVLTKAEALSFEQANMVTGEEADIRIVANPQIRRSVQADENKIAELKTKLLQAKADKKVDIAHAIETEIEKKKTAIAKLKEQHGVKLETTIEGMRARLTKLRESHQFKDDLRKDAISMVQAIPKEIQPSFINRANNVKTLKGIQKLTDEIDAGLQKYEHRAAVWDLRDTIKKVESDNRLGKVRLGKIPSPQREKIIDLIDSVDVKKLSEAKEEDLLSLQKYTQRLASQLAGNLSALDDDVEAAVLLPSVRVAELNRLSAKNVTEMDSDDVKFIDDSIKLLAGQAKLKGQLLVKGGLKPVDGAVKQVITELVPTKRAVKATQADIVQTTPTAGQKVVDFSAKVLKLDDAHLDTLVELISDPKNREVLTRILDTDLHEGMKRTADKQSEWIKRTRAEFEKIGLTSMEQLDEEYTVTLAGKQVKVTADELISLEMDMRSMDNLRSRLKSTGIEVSGKVLMYPEGIDRMKEFIDALVNIRNNKTLMGFADWIGTLNTSQRDAINETFLIERGYEIAREENYYPRSRVHAKRIEGGRADLSVPPEEQGRYQPRTGGSAPLRLRKASHVFLEGLESDAFTYGMTIPLRNARLVLGNAKLQQAMKDAGRKQELDNMITILRRTQGITTSRTTLELFGSRIQRGVVSSALGLRVSTIGTQAMSYPAAFAEINPRYMRPMTLISKDMLARIEEDSSLMALRWLGRKIGVEVGTSASADSFSLLFFGESEKLTNKALVGLVWGDKQAIGNIYQHGVLGEILGEPRNRKNVDPYEWDGTNVADLPEIKDIDSKTGRFAAARRLEYVVRRSQPMWDMMDRSVSLSNPNILERSFFIFRTAIEAQENIAIRAADGYMKSAKTMDDKLELAQKMGSVITSAFSVAVWKKGLKWAVATGATAALAAMGIFKYKDPEKDKLPESIAKDTAKNIVKLNKWGKFAVEVAERVADSLAGEGYNWNRNSFDNPILDVLQTGAEVPVLIARIIQDAGLLDEFVEETSKEDVEFNKKLADRIASDIEKAMRVSFEFGARISGVPILAPAQEFLRPLLQDSKIPIIKEVTYGDVESPTAFSERVYALYEKRKELSKKAKTQRLSHIEERNLAQLDKFKQQADKLTEIVKELSSQKQRAMRFSLFELKMSMIENRLQEDK